MIFTKRSSGLFAPDPGEALILPDRQFGIRSNVRAILRSARSGTILGEWRFHNKLVNVYLDALMTNTAGFPGVGVETDSTNWFAAGTGTTVPAVTDTALVAEIAGGRAATTLTSAYVVGPPDYCQLTRTATFSSSQANGTIGEFGWLSASSAGSMRARSVPKDTSGAQTTIPKTSGTTLTLVWNIYIFLIQADTVMTRTIGGTSYTITSRAIGANTNIPGFYLLSRGPLWATSFALGARTQSALAARTANSAAGTAMASSAVGAYTAGTYTRQQTLTTQAAASIAFMTNAGGTSGDGFANIQMGFSPSTVAGQPLIVKISMTPI